MQDHLNAFLDSVSGFKTFSSSSGLPAFQYPTSFGDKAVFMSDGKSDGMAKHAPITVELKLDSSHSGITDPTYECILQSVERVYAMAKLGGHLVHVFSFAVTNHTAWLVHFRRTLDHDNHPAIAGDRSVGELRIDRIPLSLLLPLYQHIEADCLAHPGKFFIPDTAAIFAMIRFAGHVPAFCRVKLLFKNRGGARLYAISFPTLVQDGRSTVTGRIGIFSEGEHVIKVITGDEAAAEIAAVIAVEEHAVPGFFALASVTSAAGFLSAASVFGIVVPVSIVTRPARGLL